MKNQKSIENMSHDEFHHSSSYAGRYMTEPLNGQSLNGELMLDN